MIYWSQDVSAKAAYVRLREGESVRQLERAAGTVILDLDAEGQLLGVEILGRCAAGELEALGAEFAVEPFAMALLSAVGASASPAVSKGSELVLA